MPLAVGDLIELTDVQSYLGQQVLNVYTYELMSLGADTELTDLINVFQGTVVTPILGIQNNNLVHTGVIARNLTNGIDIAEEVTSVPGGGTGEPLASFYAYGFRLVRTTAETRHGSKRIAAPHEPCVSGNSLDVGCVGPVNTAAAGMAADLSIDAGGATDFVARPVIIGRFKIGTPNAGEYDLSVINPVAAAQFIRLTTQTTRRAGRGS